MKQKTSFCFFFWLMAYQKKGQGHKRSLVWYINATQHFKQITKNLIHFTDYDTTIQVYLYRNPQYQFLWNTWLQTAAQAKYRSEQCLAANDICL
jgi:hypothetical protein